MATEKLEEILKSAKVSAPNSKKVIDLVTEMITNSVNGPEDNSELTNENDELKSKISSLEEPDPPWKTKFTGLSPVLNSF